MEAAPWINVVFLDKIHDHIMLSCIKDRLGYSAVLYGKGAQVTSCIKVHATYIYKYSIYVYKLICMHACSCVHLCISFPVCVNCL